MDSAGNAQIIALNVFPTRFVTLVRTIHTIGKRKILACNNAQRPTLRTIITNFALNVLMVALRVPIPMGYVVQTISRQT